MLKLKIYISQRKKKIIDHLKLSQLYNNRIPKIAIFLDNALNKPSKFKTKNWLEVNDEARGEYSSDKLIRFKIAMLRSSLCDYSNAYILFKGNVTVNNTGTAAAPTNRNAKVIFKNCGPFTNCITKLNKSQIDNAEYCNVQLNRI